VMYKYGNSKAFVSFVNISSTYVRTHTRQPNKIVTFYLLFFYI
jgi:hypothetical protein